MTGSLAREPRSDIAVSLDSVSVSYPGVPRPAVRDATLQVRRGERLLVTGASGSGKSTLLYAMAGIIPAVVYASVDGAVARCSERIGVVLQNPESQMIAPTVEEEIAFGLENLGAAPAEIAEKVERLIERFGLGGLRRRRSEELSGGERQKVSLAAALSHDPEIVFLDEPTAFLDPIASDSLFAMLREIGREVTLVIVEHKVERIRTIVDSVVLMSPEGRVGTRQSPDTLSSGFWYLPLLDSLQVKARHARAENAPRAERSRRMTLQCRNVSHIYAVAGGDDVQALSDISLDVAEGSAVGVMGPNGSGKSTLIDKIARLLPLERGTISLDVGGEKQDISRARARAIYGQLLVIPQNPEHMFLKELVGDELLLSARTRRPTTGHDHDGGRRGNRHLRVANASSESAGDLPGRVEEAAGTFGLLDLLDRNPYRLSEGEKRRLTLACAFTDDRRLLLLDEPSYGLDAAAIAALHRYLLALRKAGTSVIFSTHTPELAFLAADELLILSSGRMVFRGEPGELASSRDSFLRRFLPAWEEDAG